MDATLGRLLSRLEKACQAISQLTMLLMMLSISIDGLGRYLFNHPLPGGLQLTELYFMVILTFLGMPATYATGGHIRLDALRPWLEKIPFRLSERLNSVLAGGVFGIMAWQTGLVAIEKIQYLETSYGAVQLPIYLSYVWVPIGCCLLALRLTFEVLYPYPLQMSTEVRDQ